MQSLLFLIFALVACGGAIAVVFSQNVVRMAFYLVISLGSTAGLFFMLDADFVGATQLLIYVGGTVVLLIFGVMLTASGPFVSIKSSPAEIVQAVDDRRPVSRDDLLHGVAGRLDEQHVEAGHLRRHSQARRLRTYQGDENVGVREIGAALLGVRVDRDVGSYQDEGLSTGYLLPFEIVSIHCWSC